MDKACIYHVINAVIKSLMAIYKKLYFGNEEGQHNLELKMIRSSGFGLLHILKKNSKICRFVQHFGDCV